MNNQAPSGGFVPYNEAVNPYLNYYITQAGSGIPGFSGVRFQRGRGIFGKLFTSSLLPLLKTLGGHVLSAGTNVARDYLKGDSIKESAKRHVTSEGKKLLGKALTHLDQQQQQQDQSQQGSGLVNTNDIPNIPVVTTTRRKYRRKRRAGGRKKRKAPKKQKPKRKTKKTKRKSKSRGRKRTRRLPPVNHLFA